jgi:hypothetical protein
MDRAKIPTILLCVNIGYYLDEITHLFFEGKRKKDHTTMATHHFVTIGVMTLASILGYSTCTLSGIFLHDVCDVWLNLAKLMHKFKRDLEKILAFIALIFTWIACRLVAFPMMMSVNYKARPPAQNCYGFYCAFLYVGWVMTASLYVMDWIWFVMIVKIALRPNISDSRDSDEEEENKPLPPQKMTPARKRKGTLIGTFSAQQAAEAQ